MEQMRAAGSRFVVAADDDKSSSCSESISDSPYREWMLATEDKIRDKISHDFRNMRRAEINNTKRSAAEKESKERVKRIIDRVDRTFVPGSQEMLATSSFSVVPLARSNVNESNRDQKITTPGSLDVLLGRTNKKSSLGHMIFKQAVRDHRKEYEAANQAKAGANANAEKTRIVHKVLARLDASKVRFLVRS